MTEPESGVLYLVATPIGNLSDLSERALRVLKGADVIAAEDTRVTSKLMERYGFSKPMFPYHRHNLERGGAQLLEKLKSGERVALVTDAGTPGISDPGEDAVALCAAEGIRTVAIPGACAAVTALTVSGLPGGRFCFEGFLSAQPSARAKQLRALAAEKRTVIFYEAPHRLRETLADMRAAFGDTRRISLCRELTKLNEEILRTDLADAVRYFEQTEPRGEFVLVVEGAPEEDAFWSDMTVAEHVAFYVDDGMTENDAMKAAAKDRGVAKSEIYKEIKKK